MLTFAQGTGPWNLDVQVVGPKGSEIIPIKKITSPRKTIQIPIPAAIDRDGGSFEIDLGNWMCSHHMNRYTDGPLQ